MSLLETFKITLGRKGTCRALLTDLSKAINVFSHNLTIAKLHAYGFDKKSLKYILSYLKGRLQRTKVGNCFSLWSKIISGVPQGRTTTFQYIYINDLFLIMHNTEIANYDVITPLMLLMTILKI